MSLRFFIGIYLCWVIAESGLAYSKHFQRRYFIELQALQLNHNKLQTEWEQLLLEESAWSNEMRIEKIATQKLGMQTLDYSDLVMLELD